MVHGFLENADLFVQFQGDLELLGSTMPGDMKLCSPVADASTLRQILSCGRATTQIIPNVAGGDDDDDDDEKLCKLPKWLDEFKL